MSFRTGSSRAHCGLFLLMFFSLHLLSTVGLHHEAGPLDVVRELSV